MKRDRKILEHVKAATQEILHGGEKPQRISLRLIKTRSGLKSFDLQLDRLPLSKRFIDSAIETPLDLHERRVWWAIQKLRNEGKDLGVYTILDIIGVGNKHRKQVTERIKEILNNL